MANYDTDKQTHQLTIVNDTLTENSLVLCQDVSGNPLGVVNPKKIVELASLDDIQDGIVSTKVSIIDKAGYDAHLVDQTNPHTVTKAQVGLSEVENYAPVDMPLSTATQDAINVHVNDMSNPHMTNKTDIGLSEVENYSSANLPVSIATAAAIASHTDLTNNPHTVTKAQVGLGNVDNTSDLNKPVSTATQSAIDAVVTITSSTGSAITPVGTTGQRDGTPVKGYFRFNLDDNVFEGWDGVQWSVFGADNTITNHINNTDNPHEVTKATVGLSNVENLTPLNMPVSSATQSQLNLKSDSWHTHSIYANILANQAIDPNTTLVYNILTNHANGPGTDGTTDYWNIRTTFWGNQNGNAQQIALPYNGDSDQAYFRRRHLDVWNDWQPFNIQADFNATSGYSVIKNLPATFTPSPHNADHAAAYEAKNANIQAHIASTDDPHNVTPAQIGLGNVDNTSDLNKPVSTATQNALDLKLSIADIPSGPKNAGIAAFSGLGGETTVAHGLSGTPTFINAIAASNPLGHLGEIWVRADATNIYVGNSGEFTGNFRWVAELDFAN